MKKPLTERNLPKGTIEKLSKLIVKKLNKMRNAKNIKDDLESLEYTKNSDFLKLGEFTNEAFEKIRAEEVVNKYKLEKLKKYSEDATNSYNNENVGKEFFDEVKTYALGFLNHQFEL